MPSEASRKKAEEILRATEHASPALAAVVKELQGIVAAALDAARAEGVAEGEQRGAQRERWECHRIASDFSERLGGTAGAVAIRIAARGRMRGPEE